MKQIVIAGLILATMASPAARAAIVYDSIPSVIPPNVDSVLFSDASASEFGDAIKLAGTGRALTSVTVLLSSAAIQADYAGTGTAAGFIAPLTLSLYSVGGTGADPTVGSVIGSSMVNALVPWRPAAATAGCNNGDYRAANGYCYSGVAASVTFDFSGVTLPDSLIYGLSFNTSAAGDTPTGVAGPIDRLGIGLAGGATVGTDLDPDGVEWSTSNADYRSIGAANVFGPDTGWAENGTPAVRFTVADVVTPVPEPASSALLLAAVPAALRLRRRTA